MQSWVFRHRVRLRVLYGPPPSVELVGPVPVPAPVPRSTSAGTIERDEDGIVLHPYGPAF